MKNSCSDDQLFLREEDLFTISDLEGRNLKKVCHNENERQRRKKLKELYGILQSLLPLRNANEKKMSVPAVVSRVLKYIPQLQNQIEILSRDRDRLLAIRKNYYFSVPRSENNEAISFDVRISVVAKMEVVVGVQCPRAAGVVFSQLLLLFEHETLDVLNASSFVADRMMCYNIHLKVMERGSLDLSGLQLKIGRLCQKGRGWGAYHDGRVSI